MPVEKGKALVKAQNVIFHTPTHWKLKKTREGNRVLALLSTVNTVREQVQGLLCFCSLKGKWHPNAQMLQYMIHN